MLDEVAGLPRPVLIRIIPSLISAQSGVSAELRKWLANRSGGETFTSMRLRDMLRSIGGSLAVMRRVGPLMAEALTERASITSALAASHIERETRLFADMLANEIPPINFERVGIATDPKNVLFRRFDLRGRRYSSAVEQSLLRTFGVGRARRLTIDELTEKVELSLGRTFMSHRGWADRLVTTEVMHTYNTAHHAGIVEMSLQDPGYRKRWDATLDRRRCVICAGNEGEIRRADDSFPDGSMAPPAHPRCRCVLVPWHEDWEDHPSEKWPV